MKTAIALFAAALSVAALSTNASAQQRMASNLGTTFPSVVTEKGSNVLQQAGASMNTGNRSSVSVAPIPSPNPRVKVPAPDKHDAAQTQAPFQTKAFPTEEWMPSAKPAANTSFGSRSGGGIKLVSQSAGIAVEKAMNSGSSDENIAAAACTTPVNNALIAVVIIAAVDADNCPKPQAATAIEYGLIAALVGGGPDATDTTTTGEAEPEAATAIEYGLIAALIGGGPDATDTTTTGEAEPEAATAIEYGLIAALTSNGPDVTDTVYAMPEFE
jgi:Flp pilus assembly pilin Flp